MGVFDDARRERQRLEAQKARMGELGDMFPEGDEHESRVAFHKAQKELLASRKRELMEALDKGDEAMMEKGVELILRTWEGE